MDEDFTVWKRAIFILIAALFVLAAIGGLYVWYQTYLLNHRVDTSPSALSTSTVEQKRIINSLTAPAPTVTAPTATTSSSNTAATQTQSPQASSALTAPSQGSKTSNSNTQEQATINSLTAPAK